MTVGRQKGRREGGKEKEERNGGGARGKENSNICQMNDLLWGLGQVSVISGSVCPVSPQWE